MVDSTTYPGSGADYASAYSKLSATPSAKLFKHMRASWRALGAVGAARAVLDTFDALAANWSAAQLFVVASSVESIARAETARAAWHPKATGPQYLELARQACGAARTAKAIADSISQRGPEVRLLVGQLADFVMAAVHESMAEHYVMAAIARRILRELRKDQAISVSNILLADLVVIALGREPGARGEIDESTIRRRYGAGARDKPPKVPGSAEWNRHWRVAGHVTALPADKATRSTETEAAFGVAIRSFLSSAK